MQDRVPRYPGRVKLVPVSGQENVFDLVRADQPTQDGTPLSKATLLKDSTAALYGLGTGAVPDDVFADILARLNVCARMGTGTYVGNSKDITAAQVLRTREITFGINFSPDLVMIFKGGTFVYCMANGEERNESFGTGNYYWCRTKFQNGGLHLEWYVYSLTASYCEEVYAGAWNTQNSAYRWIALKL